MDTTTQSLYKVHCKTWAIAQTILDLPNFTVGIPPAYTFRARPEYRAEEAILLRQIVYLTIKAERIKRELKRLET